MPGGKAPSAYTKKHPKPNLPLRELKHPFGAMGSVSERVWIKFESDEKPHESTSTLVLTSPSGRYVDTRILVKEPGYCNHPTMQQPTGYPPLVGGVKHLDWAFWGVATVTEVEWDDVRSVMQRMSLKVDDVGLEVPTKKGEEAVEAELEPGKEMVKQVQRAKGKLGNASGPICSIREHSYIIRTIQMIME